MLRNQSFKRVRVLLLTLFVGLQFSFSQRWSPININTTEALYGIAAIEESLVAVGSQGSAFYSLEGNIWAVTNITTSLIAVAAGNGIAVAVNDEDRILFRSLDRGQTWENVTLFTSSSVYIRSLCFFKGRFLLLDWTFGFGSPDGVSTIRSSEDGKVWARPSELLPRNYGRLRPFGDNVYLCGSFQGGDDLNPTALGVLAVSSTGTNDWRAVAEFPEPLWDVAIGDGEMFALTMYSLYSSRDEGKSWRHVAAHNQKLRTASYGNGLFLFSGLGGLTVPATGASGVSGSSVQASGVLSPFFHDDRFYLFGTSGALLRSETVITLRMEPNAMLKLFAPTNLPIDVQCTANPTHSWILNRQVTLQQSPTTIAVDPDPPMFYQALLLPQ
jgi:hypothetical protein